MAAAGTPVTAPYFTWLAEVGARIKAARRAACMTQTMLATELEVHVQTVYRWEAGEMDFTVWHLKHLCRALGVTADDLLKPGPA